MKNFIYESKFELKKYFFEIEHINKKVLQREKKDDNGINIIIIIFYFTNSYLVGKLYLIILYVQVLLLLLDANVCPLNTN